MGTLVPMGIHVPAARPMYPEPRKGQAQILKYPEYPEFDHVLGHGPPKSPGQGGGGGLDLL